MDDTNLDDTFESARENLSYEDSKNSRAYTEDRYPQNDAAFDEDSWEGVYDDSYYDLTYASDEEKVYQPPLITLIETEMEHEPSVENTMDMQDVMLEENNNDPNNNMDSIEIDSIPSPQTMRKSPVDITDVDEATTLSPINFQRTASPKPGCSKDCVSLPDEKPRDEILLEKTRYILGLVSRIHRDSIFDAIANNDGKPVSELKLWDLIPEAARLEYPDDIAGGDCQMIFAKKSLASGVAMSKFKRGPEEDICEIGCKRSSSTPDISHSAPMTATNSIPKVSSSSQIAKAPTKSLVTPATFVNDRNPPDGGPVSFVPMKSAMKSSIAPTQKNSSATTTTKNSSAISAPRTMIAVPAMKATSATSATKTTSTIPATSTTVWATKTSTAIPATKTTSAISATSSPIPATKARSAISATSTPMPTTKTSTLMPATKTSAAILATKPSTLMPATKTSAAIPATKPSTAIPATKTSTAVPAKSTTSAVPDRRNAVPTANHGAIPKVYGDPGMKYGNQGKGKVLPASQALQSHSRHQTSQRVAIAPAGKHGGHGEIVTYPQRPTVTMTDNSMQGRHAPLGAAQQHTHNAHNTMPQQLHQRITQQVAGAKTQMDKTVQSNRVGAGEQQQRPVPKVTQGHQASLKNPPEGFNTARELPTPQVYLPLQEPQEAAQPVPQNAKRVICMEIYYKLINIFPNIERDYIRNLCPTECAPADRDGQLSLLIEHILERAETVPRMFIGENPDVEDSNVHPSTVDDIYENLLGIFPDADPHFLRESAESKVGKPNELKAFVETQLEQRNYPTREEYMARLKITEQQRQYTEGFNVKQYLSIIPDPVARFMDSNRKCKHSTVAFEFLKSHFNKTRVTTISKHYSQNFYNMSKTAEALEANGFELKSKRCNSEMLTADILLLQEIAFIKHKKELIDHLDNVKKTEEAEFKALKARKLLLECQCCFDEECMPSKCSNCDNGHIFCDSCVITGTSAKMGDGETRISCFVNCGSEFSLSVLQRVLAPTTFSILLKKRQAAEVIEAGLEGLVSCPFCHFASIPPEGDKIFKCLNPECTKESCRLCKELSHVPLKCDEVGKADKARHFIEEKMTEALARKCYKCKKSFFKEEGCNKITCVCGAMMCYLCDEPIKDYTHFRGQGSDDKNRCPLYSDTIRLDAVAVREIAEKAKLEVMKMNPNLNIDTTGLLPDVPRPRTGPHQNVIGADELPRRAQRALDRPPI